MTANSFPSPAPIARRVRAYFAPVDRASQTPVFFDAAQQGTFDLDAPPTPWIDLGWIQNFARTSESKSSPLMTGIPAAPLAQVRHALEARVTFSFLSWTKLTMALATGAQLMNLLGAAPAMALLPGSTSTTLQLAPSDAAQLTAGSWLAIDTDYTGQTGFIGSPVSAAYLRQPLNDIDYIRRITFNVALVGSVNDGTVMLAQPLPGGAPTSTAKAQLLTGFVDREGGSFYHEWSALFVLEGAQGERVFFHYPRLQSSVNAHETLQPLDAKHNGACERVLLDASFLALPITDPLDNERVLCYRSFLPAPLALI